MTDEKAFKYASSFILILIIAIFFFAVSFFVNDPIRAAKVDRVYLYNIDESFRYYYANLSLSNPLVFLNQYARPISILFSNLFIRILPFGILSLRLMNSFFSVLTILVLWRIMKEMGLGKLSIIIASIFTISFPGYFLASCSTLSEILFCFFLMLAVLMYIQKRYALYYILLSILPITRLEGILFLLIGILFIPQPKKISMMFCFVPVAIWIFLNGLIFGHPVDYVYLGLYKISGGNPPPDVLLSLNQAKRLIFLIFVAPSLIIVPLLFAIKYVSRKYDIIRYFISGNISIIVLLNLHLICFFNRGIYELRFIVPAIPLISIYVSILFQRLYYQLQRRIRISQYLFIGIISFTIISYNFYYLRKLQCLPYVQKDIISLGQERAFKKTVIWLREYLQREGINIIYSDGSKMTDKFIRRILINLPSYVRYYGFDVRETNLVDTVSFKKIDFFEKKALMIIVKEENLKPFIASNWKLVKSFPEINMDFYLTSALITVN